MALYGGAASRTPLLGPESSGLKPYTRTFSTGGATNTSSSFNRLLSQFQAKEKEARASNLKRYEQAMSIYDQIIARSQPGGAFEKRALGEIERRKTKGVGQEMQQLISSGLFGTTTAATAGRRWEAEVGEPARMTLEDMMEQRVTGAQQAKAGFIERRQDPYPDYSMLANVASSVGSSQTPRRRYGTSARASSWGAR